tara:strand:+ start:4317 stop:4427 length:111 start_codon:yes stop_codon:yes gene_type:complete
MSLNNCGPTITTAPNMMPKIMSKPTGFFMFPFYPTI